MVPMCNWLIFEFAFWLTDWQLCSGQSHVQCKNVLWCHLVAFWSQVTLLIWEEALGLVTHSLFLTSPFVYGCNFCCCQSSETTLWLLMASAQKVLQYSGAHVPRTAAFDSEKDLFNDSRQSSSNLALIGASLWSVCTNLRAKPALNVCRAAAPPSSPAPPAVSSVKYFDSIFFVFVRGLDNHAETFLWLLLTLACALVIDIKSVVFDQ